jgi:hypothetical protein
MNTFLFCVSEATRSKPLNSYGRRACQTPRETQKTRIDDMLQQNWSTLHSCSMEVSADGLSRFSRVPVAAAMEP